MICLSTYLESIALLLLKVGMLSKKMKRIKKSLGMLDRSISICILSSLKHQELKTKQQTLAIDNLLGLPEILTLNLRNSDNKISRQSNKETTEQSAEAAHPIERNLRCRLW